MIKKFNDIIVDSQTSVLHTLKYMDNVGRKLLLVFEHDNYLGLLSIGDIQRAIINNVNLNAPIISILQTKDRIVAKPDDSKQFIKELMLENRTEFMPVVSDTGELINVFFWEDVFTDEVHDISAKFDLPVVVMAGGIGNRLRPLTHVLPKPLIPIGDKTMLEEIFDRFNRHGSSRFFVSVNYKADLIKYYVNSLELDYEVTFFEEDKPLGTAGSLCMLKNNITETFFVTNCDNLIIEDYNEILDYHKKSSNEITVVAVVKNYKIAYGTIETEQHGRLTSMTEKPELSFKINSGMYILESHLINEIPNVAYNMTDLINKLKDQGRNVGVFPIWQSSWIDIGDWDEYLKVLRNYKD